MYVRRAKAGAFRGRRGPPGESQSPVAWLNKKRRRRTLNFNDKAIASASHQAGMQINAEMASKNEPEVEPPTFRESQHGLAQTH
jgi:hypothetical protein